MKHNKMAKIVAWVLIVLMLITLIPTVVISMFGA